MRQGLERSRVLLGIVDHRRQAVPVGALEGECATAEGVALTEDLEHERRLLHVARGVEHTGALQPLREAVDTIRDGRLVDPQGVLPVAVLAARSGDRRRDTGDVGEDLKQMLRGYIQTFNATPLASVLPSLAGERSHNPELSELFDPVSRQRRQPLRRALERGVERGELPPDLDLELAADLVVGPIAVALFFKGGKLSPRMVGPIVDMALRGLSHREG